MLVTAILRPSDVAPCDIFFCLRINRYALANGPPIRGNQACLPNMYNKPNKLIRPIINKVLSLFFSRLLSSNSGPRYLLISSSIFIWPKTEMGEMANSKLGMRYLTTSLPFELTLIMCRYSVGNAPRLTTVLLTKT